MSKTKTVMTVGDKYKVEIDNFSYTLYSYD